MEAGSAALTRDAFLRARDFVIEPVTFPDTIPELGGQIIYVRTLKSGQRDRFEGSRVRINEERKAELVVDDTRARMVSMTACDKDGVLLFTEADVELLSEKNALAMDLLYDVALRLNAMRTADLEKKLKN